MKVRTKRLHYNGHPPSYAKHPQREYELPDAEAEPLIREGFIEKIEPEEPKDAPAKKSGGADV